MAIQWRSWLLFASRIWVGSGEQVSKRLPCGDARWPFLVRHARARRRLVRLPTAPTVATLAATTAARRAQDAYANPVTFTYESAAGWQQADFSASITVTAYASYIASYHAPNGGYAVDSGGLGPAVTYGALTALANGGPYAYAPPSTFPTNTYNLSNNRVDVVFSTTAL